MSSSSSTTTSSAIKQIKPLSFPFETPDPFLFCVYHKDLYPAGNDRMEAPRTGNGADFDSKAPYRMYHGSGRVPGFPQHPHRGFETITCTLQGHIDHTDSMGNCGRYGEGDVQWMTAGKGICHSEMFPLVHSDKPNTLQLYQIWINLPKKNKMVDPSFCMHWADRIPVMNSDNSSLIKGQTASVRIWAGNWPGGARGLDPPPNSWASTAANEVAVYSVELRQKGDEVTVPPASDSSVNRALYFTEGTSILCGGKSLGQHCHVILDAEKECVLSFAGHKPEETLCLILQGKPIAEPVKQYGPFVMSTTQEIQQAFQDYQSTQFGGWPWDSEAVVFPKICKAQWQRNESWGSCVDLDQTKTNSKIQGLAASSSMSSSFNEQTTIFLFA
ncbi:unnamed protein product [Amoebophrya sp. A25]|nr:unnamed protein product [Amoebophrya sp. A25]|eukprot:GSA25T00025437001.1